MVLTSPSVCDRLKNKRRDQLTITKALFPRGRSHEHHCEILLPDVYVPCEECKGKRYNKETLSVTYKEKTIADVLEMSVEQAVAFFENFSGISGKIETLNDVGLGYIKLGQAATTLSGGESQRIKLTREFAKQKRGEMLYLLDEPTTGHWPALR